MISRFKIRQQKDKVLIKKQKKNLRTEEIEENQQSLHTDFATSEYKEILLDGVMVHIRQEEISPPLTVEVEHSFPYIKVHFELEGHSQYIPDDPKSIPVIIQGGHYNFFYLPKVKGTLTYSASFRKSLEIVVTEAYLKKAFKNSFDKVSAAFGKALKEGSPYKMQADSRPIPSILLLIIHDIISCSYQKEIKQVYLESKIKEVFSYLFSEISEKEAQKQPKKLSGTELKQILKAEKILKQNVHRPFHIENLAMLIGMNQHKLKRHFKLVFKEPIFSYLTTVRMETAKKMLIEDAPNISEVAYAVGYKNPQHFTVAFKKKFNYLPSDLKKKFH